MFNLDWSSFIVFSKFFRISASVFLHTLLVCLVSFSFLSVFLLYRHRIPFEDLALFFMNFKLNLTVLLNGKYLHFRDICNRFDKNHMENMLNLSFMIVVVVGNFHFSGHLISFLNFRVLLFNIVQ